jgi:hypothetical protein
MKPDICMYHGNCADGFTAAWAVWERWGSEVEYRAMHYGKEDYSGLTDKHVLFVDFAPKIDWEHDFDGRFWRGARSVAIIDHHKTAEATLMQSGINVLPPRHQFETHVNCHGVDGSPFIWALFDMERSGAALTWGWVWPELPAPAIVRYVEDRDLWKFKLDRSREVAANLFSHPYDFHVWKKVAQDIEYGFDKFCAAGEAIERKHFKDINEILAACTREMVIGGYVVSVANVPYTLASDAAGTLSKGKPFGACYFDRADCRVFSLRSRDDGVDVSEIAKRYGGGGHRNAAGFQAPHGWTGDDGSVSR